MARHWQVLEPEELLHLGGDARGGKKLLAVLEPQGPRPEKVGREIHVDLSERETGALCVATRGRAGAGLACCSAGRPAAWLHS